MFSFSLSGPKTRSSCCIGRPEYLCSITNKRLEAGTFDLPRTEKESKDFQIKWSDLGMMVEGIRIEKYSLKKRFSFPQG
jgi:hypothetical protein